MELNNGTMNDVNIQVLSDVKNDGANDGTIAE